MWHIYFCVVSIIAQLETRRVLCLCLRACVPMTMGCSGQSAGGSAVPAAAPELGWCQLLWPRRGRASGRHSPCVFLVSEGHKREQHERPAGSSPASVPSSCLPAAALLCFWVLQSSYKGTTPLASLPGTPGRVNTAHSLNWSCGWSERGVETL